MPKETAVPSELVFQIASECLARDENPTVVAIQRELVKRLGISGGTQVVSRMLTAWREMAASKLIPNQRIRPGVPEELVEIADRMSDQLYEVAIRKAEESFSEARADLEAQRQSIQAEIERVQADAAETARLMEETKRDLSTTADALGQEQSRAAVLESKLEASLVYEGELKADIAKLNERISNLEADKERLQTDHARQLAEENARYLAALEAERTAWKGERQHLHEQTDRLRQASKEREADLEKQLASQTGFADSYRQQAMLANQSAGKWQGQAESLQGQVEGLRGQVETLQKQVADLAEAKARAEAKVEQLEMEMSRLKQLPEEPPLSPC